MDVPINTASLQALVTEPPRPRLDYQTKTPKTDPNGVPLWQVRVVLVDGKDSAPVRISVPGEPQVSVMQPVRLVGLAVRVLEIRGETSTSWMVERLEVLGPPLSLNTGTAGGSAPAGEGSGRARAARGES
jgi:hypothetical protein